MLCWICEAQLRVEVLRAQHFVDAEVFQGGVSCLEADLAVRGSPYSLCDELSDEAAELGAQRVPCVETGLQADFATLGEAVQVASVLVAAFEGCHVTRDFLRHGRIWRRRPPYIGVVVAVVRAVPARCRRYRHLGASVLLAHTRVWRTAGHAGCSAAVLVPALVSAWSSMAVGLSISQWAVAFFSLPLFLRACRGGEKALG